MCDVCGISGGGDFYIDFFPVAYDVGEDAFGHSFCQSAYRSAGVGRVPVIAAHGVVVGDAFEMAAVVGDVEHQIDLVFPVFVFALFYGCVDADEGLVVELFIVGKGNEDFGGLLTHLLLSFEDVLPQFFHHDVVIFAVDLRLTLHFFLCEKGGERNENQG